MHVYGVFCSHSRLLNARLGMCRSDGAWQATDNIGCCQKLPLNLQTLLAMNCPNAVYARKPYMLVKLHEGEQEDLGHPHTEANPKLG